MSVDKIQSAASEEVPSVANCLFYNNVRDDFML